MQRHDQRPALRRVVVFRHVERGAARAGRAGNVHEAHPLARRVGRGQTRLQIGIVSRGPFEEKVADGLQIG